jgi:hypothetical protein
VVTSSKSSSKRIEKREAKEIKKIFFGRIKKALIFALPIEKTGNKKALKSVIKQVRLFRSAEFITLSSTTSSGSL